MSFDSGERKPFRIELLLQASSGYFRMFRYVYIFRNGVDVVYSMTRFHGFRGLSFAEQCKFWTERVFLFDFLRSDDRAITVRFEDFLLDPKSVLTRIYSHLSLPYEEDPVRFAESTLIHPLDQETTPAIPAAVLGLRSPAYPQWSSLERQTFRDICSDAMKLLGYDMPE